MSSAFYCNCLFFFFKAWKTSWSNQYVKADTMHHNCLSPVPWNSSGLGYLSVYWAIRLTSSCWIRDLDIIFLLYLSRAMQMLFPCLSIQRDQLGIGLSLLLWRYSRPTWTRSSTACCRWPCFGRGVGLDDPQRSLPTPTMLWFCDCFLTSFCVWLWGLGTVIFLFLTIGRTLSTLCVSLKSSSHANIS